MREFSKWAGRQIENVCQRNDTPRPGKPLKPPWERVPPGDLLKKIKEELVEAFGDDENKNPGAYQLWEDCQTDEKRAELQWELADVAATCMMLSARLDPIMSGLRRGRVRGREFPE